MHYDNILIIGSSGFIGTRLKQHIVNNLDVRLYLFDVALGDVKLDDEHLATKEDMYELLNQRDKKTLVFYLANRYSPPESTTNAINSVRENVLEFVDFLERIKSNAKNISVVLASSAGTIYEETSSYISTKSELSPRSVYGANKIALEFYLDVYNRIYGLDFKVARISNPYGPGQKISGGQGLIPSIINSIINESTFKLFGSGDEKRDYIYIDDLCRGLISVAYYSGKECRFNLASGVTQTTMQVIKALELASGEVLKIEYNKALLSSAKTMKFDIKNECLILNWFPEVSFEEGVKNTLRYHELV